MPHIETTAPVRSMSIVLTGMILCSWLAAGASARPPSIETGQKIQQPILTIGANESVGERELPDFKR